VLAVVALAIFALCTALSMTILSTSFLLALARKSGRGSFQRLSPG